MNIFRFPADVVPFQLALPILFERCKKFHLL